MEDKLGKALSAGKVASNVQKKLTRAQEKVIDHTPALASLYPSYTNVKINQHVAI